MALADVFVGPDIEQALSVLLRLQTMMDNRYAYLLDCGRRKVQPDDVFTPYLVAIDEIAYFSATAGDKKSQERFAALLRDLVARGRAVGIIVVAATQRPSSDIIPTSLRDLFAWRFAGRCTTNASSDIILGHGWAQQGWSANTISPTNPGLGLLIAEGGSPQLVKVAYLDDATCKAIASYATELRNAVRPAKPDLRVVA
jgi:DNA segregation ATPase FtsK/SpoIIIE, S-DNA-T family